MEWTPIIKILLSLVVFSHYKSSAFKYHKIEADPVSRSLRLHEFVKNGPLNGDFEKVTNLFSPLQPSNSSSPIEVKDNPERSRSSLETESEERSAETAGDSNEPNTKLRQGATDAAPTPSEFLGLIPLAVLAVDAPLVYVLFAFVIANLVLISVGRAELSRNIANAEQVLGNINTFTAARREGLGVLDSTKKVKKKKKKGSNLGESELVHKQALISDLHSLQSSVSNPVVIGAVLLVIYGILRIGVIPGIISGILTYFLYSNYLGRKKSIRGQGHNRVKRSRPLSSIPNSSFQFPYQTEKIVTLIHTYSPHEEFASF